MNSKLKLALLWVGISVVFSTVAGDCTSPTSTPSETTAVREVTPDQILETGVEVAGQRIESRTFRNCQNEPPMQSGDTVTVSFSHVTNWEFGGTTGVGGEVSIPEVGKLKIDAALSAKYGDQVGTTTTYSKEFDYDVPPNKQKEYVFIWNVLVHKGSIMVGGKKINYSYQELDFVEESAHEFECLPVVFLIPGAENIIAGIPLPPSQPTPTIDPTIYQFLKNWRNVDLGVDGITRIDISSQDYYYLMVHVFNKCQPSDCDWGTEQVAYSGSPVTVKFNIGDFRTTELVLSLQGNQLSVRATDHYPSVSGQPVQRDYVFQAQ